MNFKIVIPAYEPEERLIEYVKELIRADLPLPLIVDDGSGPKYKEVFDKVWQMGCEVLTHPVNRGKGAALKTAFRHILAQETEIPGVITVDCDGQHTVRDVKAVGEALAAHPNTLVLGCRHFDENTPERSAMGNRVTSWAMRVVYGINLQDTQTGLRGIPPSRLAQIAELKGERYEYELNMLVFAQQQSMGFTLVPIEAVYFDNNSGSHFRTVRDALPILGRILSGVVQYSAAAALSVVVDVFLYGVFVKFILADFPLATRLALAAVLARTASSMVNYLCNRELPYVQDKSFRGSLPRYYLLWAFQLAASIGGAYGMCAFTHIDEMVAKLLVDVVLAIISYQVQLRWVFARHTPKLPHWNVFGYMVKRVVRLSLFGWKCEGETLEEPTVYVVHHQNLYGPIHAVAKLDQNTHVWALHVFCNPKECFQQYYHYTFTQRFAWPKPIAFLTAGVLSLLIPLLMHGIGAIPVYRGSAAVRKTFRMSEQLLVQGENVVLCPDVDYSSSVSSIGEIYSGFLALDQMYRASAGKPLAFVPVHCSSARRRVCFGKPVYCENTSRSGRRRAAQLLVRQINEMACRCGDAAPAPEQELH